MRQMGCDAGRTLLRAWGYWGKAPGWYYRSVERWGPRLASDRLIQSTLMNGYRMDCDLRDQVQRQIFFLGLYEPIESYIFTKLLRPGMTVVDAGANVGQYTLLASGAVGLSGAVYSFEPVPTTFHRLQSHVQGNRLANVQLTRAALWNERSVLRIGLAPEMSENCGAYSVGTSDAPTMIECPSVRLDDFLLERPSDRVDVVKMDIEGAELFALQGMISTLRRHRPILLMEINRLAAGRLGYRPDDLWDLLVVNLGYRAWAIGHSCHVSHPLTNLNEIQQQNVLFHAAELPRSVTEGWDLKSVLRWARGSKHNVLDAI